MSNVLDLINRGQLRDTLPHMRPGDTVRVHTRIIEGNKERIQIFEGVIISMRGSQNSASVTVRKVSHASVGVERTFMVHSPRVDRFEVVRRGKVRRAKLYYLRERQGKSARIKELRTGRVAKFESRGYTTTSAPTTVPTDEVDVAAHEDAPLPVGSIAE